MTFYDSNPTLLPMSEWSDDTWILDPYNPRDCREIPVLLAFFFDIVCPVLEIAVQTTYFDEVEAEFSCN